MVDKINIPGVVWVALLLAVATFLQANFQNAEWYSLAIGFVLAVIKAIQVDTNRSVDDLLPKMQAHPAKRQSGKDKLVLWLIG